MISFFLIIMLTLYSSKPIVRTTDMKTIINEVCYFFEFLLLNAIYFIVVFYYNIHKIIIIRMHKCITVKNHR